MSAIHCFRTLPAKWLYPSAVVDFMLLYSGAKPAVRVKLPEPNSADLLALWCRQSELDYTYDVEGFACVSAQPGVAHQVLQLDRLARPHEVDLGQALGYPLCCCQRVAQIGESQIDIYAREVAQWKFTGRYERINPAGYLNGLALLSHLPCSLNCNQSLVIAEQARHFVCANAAEPLLSSLASSHLVLDEH
jgi:hypothetical protein